MNEDGGFPIGLRDALMGGWFNKATREMVAGFDIPRGTSMLDAGCGDGRMAGFAAELADRLALIDIEPANVADALTYVRAIGGATVEGKASDCVPIPYPDDTFDRIMCTEVLEHVDDPTVVMAELVRVARPGALLLLTVPAPLAEKVQMAVAPDLLWRKPHHLRVFGHDEFAALVTDAGLTIEKRSSYGFYNSVLWAMFWACSGAPGASRHPALVAWDEVWSSLLATPDGPRVKAALDDAFPKSQLIIARKPLATNDVGCA